eukprot:GFUD01013374.1.p1 GENE.GFUD01013374.1~~GFUD01013374.1.p1  ORF type:complete len:217 (-),score=68.79 GFUD01013374.1:578-1228(-)
MGDSMTSITSEPRMLERRISNQRAELNNDQQMNYLLAWFNNWSDLQKEDFVPVLAEKMSSKWAAVNGLTEDMKEMCVTNLGRPISLFQCQVNLFNDWVLAWSDDQKNYLILRLKDIDQAFSKKYEHYLEYGKDSPVKDFFEPGIPPELDLSIDRSSTASEPVDVSIFDKNKGEENSFESEDVNLNDYPTDDDLCKPIGALSPIAEDCSLAEGDESE